MNTLLLGGLMLLFSACSSQSSSRSNDASEPSIDNQMEPTGLEATELDTKCLVIFQDSQDHYWFSGETGVFEYDGESLVKYTTEDGLCSTNLLSIQEDQDGKIYFDTTEGVCTYDGAKFETLEVAETTIPSDQWKLEPGDLWFRMGWDHPGPFRYDGEFLHALAFPKSPDEDWWKAEYPNASFNPYGIYSSYKDVQGNMWFGTSSLGVCVFNGGEFLWLYDEQMNITPGGGSFGLRSIIEDRDENFWFCNFRYRFRILPETSAHHPSLINCIKEEGAPYFTTEGEEYFPYFMSMTMGTGGDIWGVTYDEGVWRNDSETLYHYPVKSGKDDLLLFSIFADHDGVIWLGTHNDGAYKFNGESFEKFIP